MEIRRNIVTRRRQDLLVKKYVYLGGRSDQTYTDGQKNDFILQNVDKIQEQ
jgi:hypothetical protein